MRFAFSTLACPQWSPGDVAERASEYGYDGVEIRLVGSEIISPTMSPADRRALKQAYATRNLPIVCLGASTQFASGSAEQISGNIDTLNAYLELASELDCPLVRTFGGSVPNGAKVDDAINSVAAALNQVARRAEELGVRVVLETHDDFSAASRVAQVLAQIQSPAIGALWDTHHPYRMGESSDEAYEYLKERLYHVHVKDARRAGDNWELVLLGEGEVPVRDAIGTLLRQGYDGYVSVEWEKKWHPEIEEPEVALPQHLDVLRGYVR